MTLPGKVWQKCAVLLLSVQSPLVLAEDNSVLLMLTLVKALVAGALLLGIAFVILKVYGKWRGNISAVGPVRSIQVNDRLHVSQKLTVYSLSWHGKEYLLAEAAQGVTVIDQRPKEKEEQA
ncbi:hypothetical protein [Microbulbifer sp. SAOS-129_SWC]|uniref:hypothetical protein n=1 Tax=Microbulbifer sp. SAOS-129_SWC TaxID=3145235 RepID=UPI00321791DC